MNYIGKEYDRVDGLEKIKGSAIYVDDYKFPNMLYVSVVRSSIPSGRISSIDTSKAFIEGVVGIYKAEDFEGDNSYGFPICDNQILSKGEVKYIGDAVCIVCAKNKETADKAAKLIRVEYEALKPKFNIEDSEDMFNKLVLKKNVEQVSMNLEDVVVELELSTKHQEHMYIEPEGAVACYEDNVLNIYSPMQTPLTARNIVAKVLGLGSNKVRVIQSTVGGAFGGKDDVVYEACGFAALGTFKTGRPCKFVASREESIISSYKRHPIKSKIQLVANKEGKLKGIKVRNKMDGGAYASVSTFVQYRNTTHSAGPYVYDWVDVENEVYYTNNVYCGAFRGFGGLQACYFYDTAIDEMSYKLDMDPIDLRLKNVWRKGKTTSTNQQVDWEPPIENILNRIREISNWDRTIREFEKFNRTNKYLKKGIGVSLGYHGISLGAEGADYAQSEVIYLTEERKLLVTCGISELGQGSRTVFSQIASEVFNIEASFIEVNNYDTAKILDSGPTVASRGSTVGGRAVKIACENFIHLLKQELAEYEGITPESICFKEGYLYINDKKRVFIIDFCRMLSQKKEVKAVGRFDMPNIDWNEQTGLGIPYVAYHYGAHVSCITVDITTGEVSVDKYFAVHDIGKVINPTALKGQINGGIATGIGYALMEDLEIHDGIIENINFDGYIIPTSQDIPQIYSEAYESDEPVGPYGAKGTGEPVLTPVPACIGNAIRFATGKRLTHLPFSLEKIVLGKELSKYDKKLCKA
ncbi:xanthine dehydrogenase family protein molybdopterin-binding subunit [Clostridium swellfunianum]|uniref:xanthine dehydrogenase family protein molybdopterin-binding subunit n=1 Tax=Clostridium swellfunianum TaxID=1367462 RepID=UPI00202F7513|nr:xanthine dehydrogenase family protein molybdopterin-binding subunit [Clostridium swellfunianum]MCM0650652.1 xanthine dehydrogenase family protein molybdopterin-binding subunit [Clostridium swellfunianum]